MAGKFYPVSAWMLHGDPMVGSTLTVKVETNGLSWHVYAEHRGRAGAPASRGCSTHHPDQPTADRQRDELLREARKAGWLDRV